MSYLKKQTLPQQQTQLQELIDTQLQNEDLEIRQRVYQWLWDNQYFVDNELFDFFLCVAQNLAAIEVLGASGEKIRAAKKELENSATACTYQFITTANQVTEQLTNELSQIKEKQDQLDKKLSQVLFGMTTEHENITALSNGLVNSIYDLLSKQKKISATTGRSSFSAYNSVITIVALFGWLAATLILLND
ncbi:MAG: hypothetical protein QNJ53_31125 [Pleurocapsa sp. MO_192.B19]|nr:hypothetical protein [Pleurocapsa sp. MO_192.B19]